MIQSENLAEKRVTEEKKAFTRRLIVRGKQTLEEIAEDAELSIEVVKDLAVLQSVPRQSFRVQSKRSFQLPGPFRIVKVGFVRAIICIICSSLLDCYKYKLYLSTEEE